MTHVEAILAVAGILLCGLAAVLSVWRLARGGGRTDIGAQLLMTTAVTWGVYAILMHMRGGGCRHGRGMALLTLLGLLFLLFSFLGIHLFAESAHDFIMLGKAGAS